MSCVLISCGPGAIGMADLLAALAQEQAAEVCIQQSADPYPLPDPVFPLAAAYEPPPRISFEGKKNGRRRGQRRAKGRR